MKLTLEDIILKDIYLRMVEQGKLHLRYWAIRGLG
jgi:hypothetical protein